MTNPIVYVLMPTAKRERAIAACERWMPMGYRMALYQDEGTEPFHKHALTVIGKYVGVWAACNVLAKAAVEAGADVCLFAGDDMNPDPNHTAQDIAKEYLERFPDGFGVMQPCGDPQGVDESGKPAAARICGSAWFGREWIRRAYRGKGPTDERCFHFYSDENLYEVAKKLGVLWMRPDLTQLHLHWSWGHMPIQDYHKKNQRHWDEDKAIFDKSKAEGFPEGEPIP